MLVYEHLQFLDYSLVMFLYVAISLMYLLDHTEIEITYKHRQAFHIRFQGSLMYAIPNNRHSVYNIL